MVYHTRELIWQSNKLHSENQSDANLVVGGLVQSVQIQMFSMDV